jgi:uncharacterized protein YecE (DUF72 family)
MPVLVGTSGWQYRDWRGRFYPPRLPQRRWLEHHAAAFATTEVNNSFYRLPAREVFEQWRARTPDDYVVTVKASRYLTHIKRLKEPEEPVARLMERVEALGDRLGAVLVQLPPNLQADVELLDACLACFPAGTRLAVEPRHPSWWNPDLRDVLTTRRAALVWADRDSRPVAPLWRTTDWGYLRLHAGGGEQVWPYDEHVLRSWVQRLLETWDDDEDVYVYTNNDPGGAALRDAVTLARLVREHGRTARRVPAPQEVSGEVYFPPSRSRAAASA